MKKSKKIKLILLPSLLLVPLTLGITLSACNSSSNDNNTNKPEPNPNPKPPVNPEPTPPKPDPNPIPPDPEKPVEPNPIPPTESEQKYQITFKEKSEFEFGDPNTQIWNIDSNWIKQKILANKSQIFNIPSNLNSNFDWNNNLEIGQFFGNSDLGEITFDLTLRKANNVETELKKYITKEIKITGFSYTSNKLREEVKRINELNNLQLMFTNLTNDELDFLNQDNILHYLNQKFESKDFDYNAIEFKKDSSKSKIEFKIQVRYKSGSDVSTEPLETKTLSLNYTFNPNQINYSVNIDFQDPTRKNNYEEYIYLIGNLNTGSTLFNFNWSVTDLSNSEIETIQFTNISKFFAWASGKYLVNLEVTNTKNQTIAKTSIEINCTNEYYNIGFDDPNSPKCLDNKQNHLPSYYLNNEIELKEIINKDKDLFFERFDDLQGSSIDEIQNDNISKNFLNNLKINKIIPNDDLGKLTVNLTLNNANSDSKSITNDITLFNFDKNWSNDEVINNVLNKVIITSNDDLSKYTAKEAKLYNKKLFSLDESKYLQEGVKVSFDVELDDNKPSEIIFKITGTLLTDESFERIIYKTQGGFNVIKNLGELDLKPNTILKTPSNAIDYKHDEVIKNIDLGNRVSGNLDTGTWFSKAKNFGWAQYEKEVVYHARFALYQAFHDNFTEINYYSLNDPNNIHVIAEGVVKENFNGQYRIQSTQEMTPRNINIQSGQILRVEYIVPKTNEKSFYPTTHATSFSFSNDSMNLSSSYGYWRTFGMQLPGYKLNIQKFDQNGRKIEDCWNHSNNKMRSYIFSIGGSQGRVN